MDRCAPPGESLDCRSQADLVESGRPKLRDQGAKLLDLAAQLGDRVPGRSLEPRCAALEPGREDHPQGAERLERFVVKLARPAPTLALRRLDAMPEALLCDGLGR